MAVSNSSCVHRRKVALCLWRMLCVSYRMRFRGEYKNVLSQLALWEGMGVASRLRTAQSVRHSHPDPSRGIVCDRQGLDLVDTSVLAVRPAEDSPVHGAIGAAHQYLRPASPD